MNFKYQILQMNFKYQILQMNFKYQISNIKWQMANMVEIVVLVWEIIWIRDFLHNIYNILI